MYTRLGILLIVVLAGCGGQSATTPPPTPETATTAPFTLEPDNPTSVNPTPDLDSLQATSDAMSEPIRRNLEAVAGVESVTLVSAMLLDTPIVTAEIVSASNDEPFVQSLLAAVQQAIPDMTEFRVTIVPASDSTSGTIWLWENGAFTSESFG